MKETILDEAKGLVYGDRSKSYGPVSENFTRIADMWGAILNRPISPEEVGLCMVALKIARQCHKPSRDNLVDGAGYFATLEKMADENIH